jgi:ABC-2 type transport system ATP-binding protein
MTDSHETVRTQASRDHVIEIHEPGKAPRRLTVVGTLELGRDCDGEVLDDAEVSRRHVRLVAGPAGLTVEDLGSSNGTTVNDQRLTAAVPLHPGDIVLLGRTKIVAVGPTMAAGSPRETMPPVRAEAPVRSEAPARAAPPPTGAPVVTVRDLRKMYGSRAAVNGVNFDIRIGECYGLLGPNGAGKTTTISMLCGLLDRDGGDVTVAGQKLDPGATQAKAAIGYVPQDIALYLDMSARENLHFFGRLYGLSGARLATRIDATLEAVGLKDREDDKVGAYSGGMARRINIAVGLLHEPKLLVLDEPTVGVDPQSRNAILEAVEKLSTEGMAVLYTTHYMEEAERLCDRVGIIDEGRIVAEGTRRELVAQVGERDRLRVSASGPLDVFARECLDLDGVEGADVTEDGIELLAQNGQALLVPLVRKAEALGVKVTGVDVVEPDLEAVFLHLTGKALRD